jgi:hypothetical protein
MTLRCIPFLSVLGFFVLNFLMTSGGWASTVRLEVSRSPQTPKLGQPLLIQARVFSDQRLATATLHLDWPDGQLPLLADEPLRPQQGWTTWTLLSPPHGTLPPTASPQNPSAITRIWQITPFATGDIPGPTVRVEYLLEDGFSGTAREESPSTVTVQAIRAADDRDLRTLRPPVLVPVPGWFAWAVLGAIALATAGVIWLAWSFARHRSENARKLGPEERSLAELQDLDQKDLPQKRLFREYFTRLSEILRTYLETTWNVRAMELTTYELRTLLTDSQTEELSRVAPLIFEVLEEADSVKFAKGEPTQDLCRRLLTSTREILEELRQKRELRALEVQRKAGESGGSGSKPQGQKGITKS